MALMTSGNSLGEAIGVAICRRFFSGMLESHTPCITFSPWRRALSGHLSSAVSIE